MGVAGRVVSSFRADAGVSRWIACGPLWTATNPSGEILSLDARRLRLEPGDSIRYSGSDSLPCAFEACRFDLVSMARKSRVELALEPSSGSWVVIEWNDRRVEVWSGAAEPRRRLAMQELEDGLAPGRATTLELKVEDGAARLRIDGGAPLEFGARQAIDSISLLPTRGTIIVNRMSVAGTAGADRSVEPFQLDETFQSLRAASTPTSGIWLNLAVALAVLGLAGCFLRLLCLGAPSFTRVAFATLVLFVPGAIGASLGLFGVEMMTPAAWVVAAVVGYFPAVFGLRRDLDAPGAVPVVAVVVGLAATAAATVAAAGFVDRAYAFHRAQEEAVRVLADPPPERTTAPIELCENSAWTSAARWRDLRLSATITAEPDAIIELRVRDENPQLVEAVALIVSPDPAWRGGFYDASRIGFDPIGERALPIPAGRPIEVVVEVRGRRVVATADGRALARAEFRKYPSGGLAILTARGRALLESVDVVPIEASAVLPSAWRDRLSGAATMFGWLAGFALLVVLLLRIGLVRAIASGGIAVLPAAAAFTEKAGGASTGTVATALAATVLFLTFLPMAHGRRFAGWKYVLLLAYALGGAAFAFQQRLVPAWPPTDVQVSEIRIVDWHGDHLTPGLEHVQHPALRRWNFYLKDHTLRNRSPSIEKSPGTKRVMFLGTSSTYGYRAKTPYGFVVEERLRDEGRNVEAIVGAVPGATGTRQLFFFENVLHRFAPEVVCLSLFYNDAISLGVADELAYLDASNDVGVSRSTLDDLRLGLEIGERAERIRGITRALTAGESWSVPDDLKDVPARFGRLLERFVRASREHGFRLVLIKEPYFENRDRPRVFASEFYAEMDAVAARHGLEVIDPKPFLIARGGRRLFMDPVHPTDAGHEAMADAILPALRRVVDAVGD